MHINNQPIWVAESNRPDALKDWREYQDSLTDKLQSAKGSVQLELLAQQWIKPTWWDKYLLQISDEFIFQREIMMKHLDIEYWYARTIIPKKCYNLNPDFFKRLEKESIRNLIFNNDKVHRVTMINYPVDDQCIELFWVKKHLKRVESGVWARLSEFSFEHLESFYLIELLFPELEGVA